MLIFSHERSAPAVASAIGLALAIALSLASPASASYRRHDEVAAPDVVTVRYTRQGWLDVVTRVLLFGMSRQGSCQICYGGVLRIASDKTGPGGELNVVYYRGSAPEGGNAHCKDGAAFTIPESELRFYEKFAGLKERAIRSIENQIGRAVADAGTPLDRAGHGAGIPLRKVAEGSSAELATGAVRPVASNRFVTSATLRAASPYDGVVPFGESCKLCPSQAESYDRFKVVKGFIPYVDPDTRETKRAVVWEYWSGAGGDRTGSAASASWRECSRGTLFVEPDFLGRTLEVMTALFADHALDQMERFVVQIESVQAP